MPPRRRQQPSAASQARRASEVTKLFFSPRVARDCPILELFTLTVLIVTAGGYPASGLFKF
jgi:hypothetical protein